MIELSIIIPVYNVEKYIKRCILSALDQDVASNKYEIVIVDDESPDNSVNIVKELMSKHKNIFLYSQKNKGLGGARNTGIKNAKGKYLLFLDADDYLNSNISKNIIDIANNKQVDILEFGATGVTEDKKVVYTKSMQSKIVTNGYEYLQRYEYMNSACNKLYASNFLKMHNLFFKERIFIEDFEFNTRAFYYADRVYATNNIVSNFVQTPDSITRNTSTNKHIKMIKDIEEVIYLTSDFKNTIAVNKKSDIDVIDERIAFLVVTLMYNMLKFNIGHALVKDVISKLILNELLPVKKKIKNKEKNIFRIVVNNTYLFYSIMFLKRKITS